MVSSTIFKHTLSTTLLLYTVFMVRNIKNLGEDGQLVDTGQLFQKVNSKAQLILSSLKSFQSNGIRTFAQAHAADGMSPNSRISI